MVDTLAIVDAQRADLLIQVEKLLSHEGGSAPTDTQQPEAVVPTQTAPRMIAAETHGTKHEEDLQGDHSVAAELRKVGGVFAVSYLKNNVYCVHWK